MKTQKRGIVFGLVVVTVIIIVLFVISGLPFKMLSNKPQATIQLTPTSASGLVPVSHAGDTKNNPVPAIFLHNQQVRLKQYFEGNKEKDTIVLLETAGGNVWVSFSGMLFVEEAHYTVNGLTAYQMPADGGFLIGENGEVISTTLQPDVNGTWFVDPNHSDRVYLYESYDVTRSDEKVETYWEKYSDHVYDIPLKGYWYTAIDDPSAMAKCMTMLDNFYLLKASGVWGEKEYRDLYTTCFADTVDPTGSRFLKAIYGMNDRLWISEWTLQDEPIRYKGVLFTFVSMPPDATNKGILTPCDRHFPNLTDDLKITWIEPVTKQYTYLIGDWLLEEPLIEVRISDGAQEEILVLPDGGYLGLSNETETKLADRWGSMLNDEGEVVPPFVYQIKSCQ